VGTERQHAPTASTRLEQHFDPDAVERLKAEATSNLTIGGANLAARAFEAGLVDKCQRSSGP
jgi:dihydrofolate reductase